MANNFWNMNQKLRSMDRNYNNYQIPAMGNVQDRMYQQQIMSLPHYDAPLIHGRTDADNFVMGPNSQIYLPDADEDIIWWIRTDNVGGRIITPFDVTLHEEPQPVSLEDIAARLAALEDTINAKQNKSNAKRSRGNASSAASTAADATIE